MNKAIMLSIPVIALVIAISLQIVNKNKNRQFIIGYIAALGYTYYLILLWIY